MKKIILLFLIISNIIPLAAKTVKGNSDPALDANVAQWMGNSAGLRFLENKGQMMDMQRKPVPNVLYEASSAAMDVYVTTSGLSYVFVDFKKYKNTNSSPVNFKHTYDSITETYCRADMQLVGASIKKENIVQEGASTDRTDYYYGDVCPNGVLGVRSYEKVTIKNIYPGIDWVLHSGKNGLKYDFVVHPGADPSQIKLQYKWTDQPQLQDDGSVNISTPMGTITEGAPISYTKGKQVHTTYNIQDKEIHFNIENYNVADTLIIDPQLVWATYYAGNGGSGKVEDVYGLQDDGTSVWVTGGVNMVNFPTLNPGNGAYFQGTIAGKGNAFILQFSTAGVLEWATYYGGNGLDQANSIYSNGTNVWITGMVTSSNFPTFNPGGSAYYQGALGAANARSNAFILEFSTAGVRKWATYYGGSFIDEGFSIHSSGTNIWITGITSSTNFPTVNPGNGAYFQNILSAIRSLFIVQFDTTRAAKWATYYGGSDQTYGDWGFSVNSNSTNVWITGTTASTNFPTFNPGGGAFFQGTIGSTNGGFNAYILQFSNTGVRKWATYLGGNDTTFYSDLGTSIYVDSTNVWLTGQTGSTNFPTHNPGGGAYFQGGLGSTHSNVFISQFDHSGVMKWSTYYGGNGIDAGYSIQNDGSNVWISGQTSSSNFPIQRPSCGYYDSTVGGLGNTDAFMLEFSTGGALQWATYYGTDIENDNSYAWSDGSNLFIAGDAGTNGYPTKNPGGGAYFWDSTVTSGEENLFIGKFIISGHGASSNVAICKGSSTTLSASGGISYSWSPSTGLSATNISNPVASPTVTTTYTVTIVDTGACGGTFKDSVKVTVDTLNFKNIRISSDTSICTGNSVTLHASGGPNYKWSTGATTTSITIANDSATQTYTLAISNGACIKDTGVKVTVNPKINGAISGNITICSGHSTTLSATGGTTYQWSTGSTESSITVSPSSGTTYSVLISGGGCSDALSASVSVSTSPVINACCNSSIEPGQQVQLGVTGAGSSYSYSWSPNYDLSCTQCPDPIATPQQTTTYTVVAINDTTGCISLSYVTIDVSCGTVFVPDAFTPLKTHNNILYVRGNCIVSLLFEVFDRWGQRVFESTSIDNGWDGNFKNKPMNMDMFVWYLKATLKDGTTVKRSGNVTLVR